MNDPDERIRRMRELRDAKAIPHLQQYAPVWLVSETPLLKDDALQFNVVFYHPYYGWVSRRYRFDAFNNVLYHQGQTALSEDEALLKNTPKTRGAPLVELTYNWDEEKYGEDRYFGHLAYEVDDIYATCDRLMKMGITINRPPRDGNMAFIRSPDNISIELLQKGQAKAPEEPWASMGNTGHW